MKIEMFNGKKVRIRKVSTRDLKHVKKFQDFINSLIEEGVQILYNEKQSLEEEKKWLERNLRGIRQHRTILLLAEYKDQVIATTWVGLGRGRNDHVGYFGITIRKEYRGIGLGTYLMGEIIKLAKKELKLLPKIIRLSVLPGNKPAITLYKKFGFKKFATIPEQFEHEGELLDEIIMLLYL